MLELDADKRMTAEKALAHPYLAQYADPSDEPNSPPYDQSFEDMELNVEKWKGEVLHLNIYYIVYYLSLFILSFSYHSNPVVLEKIQFFNKNYLMVIISNYMYL